MPFALTSFCLLPQETGNDYSALLASLTDAPVGLEFITNYDKMNKPKGQFKCTGVWGYKQLGDKRLYVIFYHKGDNVYFVVHSRFKDEKDTRADDQPHASALAANPLGV